ncbi:MAG: TPM domain-containing protein [Muribaculaceae bacterium]|nr:TPM domain-containing protein [Muribaculaceae bacterium]
MENKSFFLKSAIILFAFLFSNSIAYAEIVMPQDPPRLVNDFAGIFEPEKVVELEDSLVRFAKRTSNQITIVTVTSLDGMDKAQYAYEIGEKWGVGSKKLNNGIVILIKPKNDTNGEVFIATGYGLEGALPDAACNTIIENEMVPEFKNKDYYAGLTRALDVIMPIAAKEYTFEEYEDDDFMAGLLTIIIIIVIVIILSAIFSKGESDNGKNSGTIGGGGFFIGGGLGRSSGSSGFGGGSGGFGGFGGGSFGGGGAGGSW